MLTIINSPSQDHTDYIEFITTHIFELKIPLIVKFEPSNKGTKRFGVCRDKVTLTEVVVHTRESYADKHTIFHELRHVEQFQYNILPQGSRMWEKDADKYARINIKKYDEFKLNSPKTKTT